MYQATLQIKGGFYENIWSYPYIGWNNLISIN